MKDQRANKGRRRLAILSSSPRESHFWGASLSAEGRGYLAAEPSDTAHAVAKPNPDVWEPAIASEDNAWMSSSFAIDRHGGAVSLGSAGSGDAIVETPPRWDGGQLHNVGRSWTERPHPTSSSSQPKTLSVKDGLNYNNGLPSLSPHPTPPWPSPTGREFTSEYPYPQDTYIPRHDVLPRRPYRDDEPQNVPPGTSGRTNRLFEGHPEVALGPLFTQRAKPNFVPVKYNFILQPIPLLDIYPPNEHASTLSIRISKPRRNQEEARKEAEEVSEQYSRWSQPIIAKLKQTFQTKAYYRQFLSLRGSQGQQVLDLLQLIMNLPSLEDQFRSEALAAMQRLSITSSLYPTCFDLKDAVRLDGEGPVAAGSFADIRKGYFQDQPVCIKSIRVYQKSKVDYIAKHISREVILWSGLSHPNLLPFYGVYRDSLQRVCLISPWIDNGHIKEYLENNPNADRARLSLDVAAGIAYLHEMGIIHGDLKGPNILVGPSGRACLADFGLSGVIDHHILNWTSQSSLASAGGSVRWQAPELLAPEDTGTDTKIRNTKMSDVYAWSCVCYEIFTSHDPFYEEARNSTVTLKIMRGDTPSCPPPMSAPWHRWGLTQPIWDMVSECWSYDPVKRPSIDDIIARLKDMLEESVDIRAPQSWGYIPTWRFRDAVNKLHNYLSIEDLDRILRF